MLSNYSYNSPVEKLNRSWWVFFGAAGLFLSLSLSGIRFGLPDSSHILSYSCDETGWIEALALLTPARRFNPHPELTQPLFFEGCFAAAVGVGAVTGWIPIHQSKDYFRVHPEVFARIYLAGRALESVFGLLLLFSIWLAGRSLFDDVVGNVAVLLLAVTPGLVGASHFIQSNMAVTTVTFMSLAFLLADERELAPDSRWFWAGCYACGVAVATKYSAVTLIPVCFYQSLRGRNRWNKFLIAPLFLGLGFLTGEPFVLLAPRSFIASFHVIAGNVRDASQMVWSNIFFPILYAVRFALGTPLWVAAAVSVTFLLLYAWRKFQLPLLWLGITLFCVLLTGRGATSGRVLLMAPVFVFLTAVVLAQGFHNEGWVRIASGGAFIFLFGSTLVYSLSIVALHRGTPIQKQASFWIESNIPTTAAVGIPSGAYYWSPDIILNSYFWPQRMTHPYHVTNLDYSVSQGLHMDYILVAVQEFNPAETNGSPAESFCKWLSDGHDFQLIHTFPRQVGVGPFHWSRPEFPLVYDDDLWSYSYYVYQRKT